MGQTAYLIMQSGTSARFVFSQVPVRKAKADDAAVCGILKPVIGVARSQMSAHAKIFGNVAMQEVQLAAANFLIPEKREGLA